MIHYAALAEYEQRLREARTDSSVFGSEAECFAHFRDVIEKAIADIQTPDAVEIRGLLEHDDLGAAYDLWQATYKDELSTYNGGHRMSKSK